MSIEDGADWSIVIILIMSRPYVQDLGVLLALLERVLPLDSPRPNQAGFLLTTTYG